MFNYCAILGVWFPGCPLFRGNFVLESAVGSVALVRCPEYREASVSRGLFKYYNYSNFIP